ncbi:MAG: hypothetical protein LAT64_13570 [Phycisphaerales bacterium]|nr:hypothetical protein [Planctomycetota bacterium]MCH8509783.1 hypothetical protein [Phycisphaerales bacterium]
MPFPRKLGVILSVLLLGVPAAHAGAPTQDAGSEARPAAEPEPRTMTLTEAFAQVRRVEPIRRAGLRADLLRRTQQVVPAVVIVTDARGYLAAIAGWDGQRRYPVLWDDGSVQAREDIARFVRAFEPEAVYRLEAGRESPAWPRARADRESVFRQTLAHAAGDAADDFNAVLTALRDQGVVSPGIVLTDVDDPAWPAALALSAARYQPIGFIERPSTLNPPLTPDQADLLETAAQRLAESTGLSWTGIGDDIDAITLCLNTGTRIKTGEGARDILATTDRVGRLGDNGSGRRWAYTGQIFGSFAQSTYRAMCAVFLTPSEAFIFDGYEDTQPWITYSGREAAGVLAEMNIRAHVHAKPGNTTTHWLALTARPVRAGLIMINSMGGQAVLTFPGGTVRGGNAPILEHPAIAHIVHSFSMANAPNRATVGGAFLDRGVYAALGSVDEPYLQAFVPTPMVARRLGAGLNFAAAARLDDAPVWKLTVLGDPLITLGPPGTRLDAQRPEPAGTLTSLDETLKSALSDRELARAAEILTLLGRDADVARIAAAVLDDPDEAMTPDLAAAAIPALFRQSRHEQVVDAYTRLDESRREDPVLSDCFWYAGRFLLGSSTDADRVELIMRTNPRPGGQRIDDAEEIARRIQRRSSTESAVAYLESLRSSMTQAWELRTLNAAVDRIRTGGR